MENNSTKAIVRLKELQAQIGGMRLALTTSCSNCDVESVVSLLKVVNTGVGETIKILEAEQFKLENEEELDPVEKVDIEANTSEVQTQINELLSKSVDRTMDLTKQEDEIPESDIDAIMSLAGYMAQNEQDAKVISETIPVGLTQVQTETISMPTTTKQSLSQVPVHFDSPEINPEDFTNERI